MTAHRIAPKLYQGSFTDDNASLQAQGVQVLVLCALELQPPDSAYPGIEVIRCPFDDSEGQMPFETIILVNRAASAVAAHVRRQKRVLVTCHMGLNRSGLVTALALTEIYGMSGKDAVAQVRRQRHGALFNSDFVALVEKVPARRGVSAW